MRKSNNNFALINGCNQMALPCGYCGKLTGNFCDGQRCEDQPGFSNVLWSECETEHHLCPTCVQAGLESFTVLDESHWQIVTTHVLAVSFPIQDTDVVVAQQQDTAAENARRVIGHVASRWRALLLILQETKLLRAGQRRERKSDGFAWNYKYQIL